MIADSSSGNISIKNGFRGPNFVTTSACASSSDSIVTAYNYIRLGMAAVMVTGGSEAALTEAGVGGFNALKAMSERNDDPTTASRPYDKDRDGFVLGEGAGALILEEYEHAKARGAKIYAEIIGGGLSSDAYHITAPDPNGDGVVLVMQNALRDAGIEPGAVDYINTHGTSTPLGDGAEVTAIQKVFGEHAYNLNISSTKSMTGHLLGGAGGIEAVAAILAIQHNIVPPTINHFTDDETIDQKLNFTFNKAQSREVNVALSNTFGFGGHNTTVIFRKIAQ
jgi:3-oxoacyl-[acyl-carrier-protein] synthase II